MKNPNDPISYQYIAAVLQYHISMLTDGARNRPFYEALRDHVTPQTRFLDIGAGTGVWAIMAAKLGAKRAVAIEREEMLIPFIYQHARENGVADRVEIYQGTSFNVRVREKFDLIVSETIGNEAFNEGIVETFLDARRRFLAPGGLMIPQSVTMMCAPVFLKQSVQAVPSEIPFSCEFVKSLALNIARKHVDRDRVEMLGEPKPLLEIDLMRITENPDFANLSASWKLPNVARANAFLLFAKAQLTESIAIDTFETTSWAIVSCEFMPFDAGEGEIRFDLTFQAQKPFWTVSLPSSAEMRPRSYSPVFPHAKITMGVKTTPRRKFKPRKESEKVNR